MFHRAAIVVERAERVYSYPRTRGLDSAEVVGLLGITEGNQRVLLHRARMRLRACLEGKGWTSSS